MKSPKRQRAHRVPAAQPHPLVDRSSSVANPSSYMRTAAIRYGTRSMLTMNPDRSLVSIGTFPIRSANSRARAYRLLARVQRDDDLDQLHHRHRGEEVQAEHTVRACGLRTQAGQSESRRCWRRLRPPRRRVMGPRRGPRAFSPASSGIASITRSVPARSSSSVVYDDPRANGVELVGLDLAALDRMPE